MLKTGPLPHFLSKERKAEILEKRAQLKLKAPAAAPAAANTVTTMAVVGGSRDHDNGAVFGFTDFYG